MSAPSTPVLCAIVGAFLRSPPCFLLEQDGLPGFSTSFWALPLGSLLSTLYPRPNLN